MLNCLIPIAIGFEEGCLGVKELLCASDDLFGFGFKSCGSLFEAENT
jgi:hypothetical protein